MCELRSEERNGTLDAGKKGQRMSRGWRRESEVEEGGNGEDNSEE